MARPGSVVKLVIASLLVFSTQAHAVNVNQPGGGYVSRLYATYLGRAADEGGFNFWVGQYQAGTWKLEDLKYFFQTSSEAQGYNASQQIAQYYRDLFGGEADPGGLAFWTHEYTSGARTLANIRATLATYSGSAIEGLYQEILHRASDPGGMSFYLGYLASGKTLTDIRYAMFYGAENVTNFPGSFAAVCDEMKPYDGMATDVASILEACISQTASGATLFIPRGKYILGHQITIARPITLATQFSTPAQKKCSWQENHDCAELKAAPGFQDVMGIIDVTSGNVTLDHLVVNGNKTGRLGSFAAGQCAAGNANAYGYNAWMGGDNITVTNSVFKNALCGTGVGFGWGGFLRFEKNTVAFNGTHDVPNMWSDGMTLGQPYSAVVSNNEFMDNTDVDLIFGSCPNCTIQSNTITHSNSFSSSSFAAMMLHAWPGWPAAGTSGDYSGADVSGNFIDCVGNNASSGHRCGFGLYLGASAWYASDSHGGFVHDNVINGAQQGFSIDKFRELTIANNYVSESGGTFQTSCGPRALTAYNITPGTQAVVFHPSETISWLVYTPYPHEGCIPNWWSAPY